MRERTSDRIAEQILLLLLRGGSLRPVRRGEVIASGIHLFPAYLRLRLPAEEPYLSLLNPAQREGAVAQLRAALLGLLEHAERDAWVVEERDFTIDVQLAEGAAKPRAEALYEEPVQGAWLPETTREPMLRLRIAGDKLFFYKGEGLRRVLDRPGIPKLTVLEAEEPGATVAFLYASGPLTVETADGYRTVHPAFTRVPVSHDLKLLVEPPRWRFWMRPADGHIEVLGVSRTTRPVLVIRGDAGEVLWDRNREPTLAIAPGGRVSCGEARVTLRSLDGDRIVATRRAGPDVAFAWNGGLLALDDEVPTELLGTHLSGVHSGDARVSIEPIGATPAPPPIVRTVSGRRLDAPGQRSADLFRYEQAHARVFQEGALLEDAPEPEVHLPVLRADLAAPLADVAFDGCAGAKVLRRHADAHLFGAIATLGVWHYVSEVVTLILPNLRARIEVMGTGRIVFDEPVSVVALSGDPDDVWTVRGWTVRAGTHGVELHGPGWVPLKADGAAVTVGSKTFSRPEVRFEVGGGIYRVVRRAAPGTAASGKGEHGVDIRPDPSRIPRL